MSITKKFKIIALSSLLAGSVGLAPCSSVNAADLVPLDTETVPNVFGLGVGILPDYSGSDDYTFGIAPFFRYTFRGQQRYVQLIANELTFNVLDDKMFSFGPLLNYHFGRDDDVDDKLVSKMDELDDTVEAGAFLDVTWYLSEERRHRFILGGKFYQDITDESNGFRANINARYWVPVARPVDLNVTVGAYYQNDHYSNYYYGVNAGNVGTSGLPFFTADGGVNEYYMVLGGVFYFNTHWLMSAGIRCAVLTGDPSDSPIVDQRGDSTQWIAGLGVGYAF